METQIDFTEEIPNCYVLILPMRNGNSTNLTKASWTIERSYPTYEEWKLVTITCYNIVDGWEFLSYLWGMETINWCSCIKCKFKVLILPMRNGNTTLIPNSHFLCICSYPTYEEWKLDQPVQLNQNEMRSYPTYEEWKLGELRFINVSSSFSSYPTYEEWKLSIIILQVKTYYMFLSYLWGMETYFIKLIFCNIMSSYPTYEEWKHIYLIK